MRYGLLITLISLMTLGCSSALKLPEFKKAQRRSSESRHIITNHTSQRAPATFNISHIELIWPVSKARITQKFAPPKNPKHDGIDIGGRLNTPIKAAHSGIIVYAGRRYSGYGNMVLISNGAETGNIVCPYEQIKSENGRCRWSRASDRAYGPHWTGFGSALAL
ncbi:MAG: M23 family metallopeptidase [Bdellovibrionales bacterium]